MKWDVWQSKWISISLCQVVHERLKTEDVHGILENTI